MLVMVSPGDTDVNRLHNVKAKGPSAKSWIRSKDENEAVDLGNGDDNDFNIAGRRSRG